MSSTAPPPAEVPAPHAVRRDGGAGWLVDPPGRQGPGRVPAAAVHQIDLAIARRGGGLLPGEHLSAGLGSGTEIAQLRPYVPGDDLRQLDPAASARTNEPHVRVHVPERALTTWIVLDLSPGMAFGTALRLKSDVAAGVAHVVARLGVRRGGRVGLLTCGAPTERMLRPRGGRGAVATIDRVLDAGVAADRSVRVGGLDRALRRVARITRHPGLVVVVSDLRDDTAWARPLAALGERHSVAVVEVSDPREHELPDSGSLVLVDPATGEVVEAETGSRALRDAYAAAAAQRATDVRHVLRRARAMHVQLRTDEDWLRELARRLR